MNRRKKPELLSPAGDFDKLRAAIAYGADAVYLGGEQYGLRKASRNFTVDEIYEAVKYAHERNVKAYLTLNATARNDEINGLAGLIKTAADAGVDAFIIADIGVMTLAKRLAPNVDIHISTQTGVVNYVTARSLAEMGAKRIVLARELGVDEIRTIKSRLPESVEIEVFVHGAMCVSYSGRCLLSNYMASRDSNGGACAQPCRWNYALMEEKRPGEYFPVYEDGGTFILNSKDLCLIDRMDKLFEAGIDSLKIEGRVKTEYYVACVTGAYRRAIDDHAAGKPFDPKLYDEVCKVSHRDYYTGFFLGDRPDGQIYTDNTYIRDFEISAVVDGYENGEIICRVKNPFFTGDRLELLTPDKVCEITVSGIRTQDKEATDKANHPEQTVFIPFQGDVKMPAYLRKEVI